MQDDFNTSPSRRPSGPERIERPGRDRSEPLGEILRRWVRRSGVLEPRVRDRIWASWERLLGRDAAHTELVGLRNHVVTFRVDSSPLLSELASFRKQDLLEGLRADVKSYFVRDIRFRLEKQARGPRRHGERRAPGEPGG